MRNRGLLARVAAAGVGVLALAPTFALGGLPTTGASFTAQTVGPAQAMHTTVLDALDGGSATYQPNGQGQVSWTIPTARPDATPTYTIQRIVDTLTTTITPTVGVSGTTAQFTDNLTVAPERFVSRNVTSIGADTHSCAVADGAAYCWGLATAGRMGDGNNGSHRTAPVAVSTSGVLNGKTVTNVSPGTNHTCAVASGAAYCWGSRSGGLLGDGTTSGTSLVPVAVSTSGALAGKTVTTIDGNTFHTCAVASGAAYCWGRNNYGQLGNGTTTNSAVPVAVGGALSGKTVTAIGTGDSHTCAVANGAAYCWGYNSYGQLGNGTTTTGSTPVLANGALSGKTVTAISGGDAQTCALASGAAYCWGKNSDGELGTGGTANRNVPVAVDTSGDLGGKTVTAIDAGSRHTCAVADAAAYCWGANFSGQVGNGTTTGTVVPVAVQTSWPFGLPDCETNWIRLQGRCTPGPDASVSYRIGYTKRGWSPPDRAELSATWTGA